MRITVKALKEFVRHMLSEAEKEEKAKKVPPPSPFSCPRHNMPLEPIWGWADMAIKQQGQAVQPFGPMEPGQSRNIAAPTSKFAPNKGERKKQRFIRNWVCPLWEEDGPYGYDPKKKKGHACDFRVSARVTRPGQKFPHEARGEVAEEEGMLFQPIKPKQVQKETPPAFLDMIEKMDREGFNWKKVQGEPGTPPQFKKVPSRGKKRFTGDDVQYLSYFYPKMLMAQQKAGGANYNGPKHYYFSSDKVFRAFRAKGWEPADPEGSKERKVTPPSMPGKEKSVTAKMSRTPSGEEPWYHDDDDDFSDLGDDDDLDDLGVDDDDEDVPERWR